MKKLIATTVALLAVNGASAQLADMLTLPGQEALLERPQFSDDQLLETWGWLLGENFNLAALELSEREIDLIADGLRAYNRGEQPVTELEQSQEAMQAFFTRREARIRERQLAENRESEDLFFSELFGKPGVESSGTGLHYQIKNPGNDVKPEPEDTVYVVYQGRFLDNTIFDEAKATRPVKFKLNQVIPGWSEGLQLIGEGGKIKLFVPSKLGYGDEGRPGIPPASTLVFEIQLLKVGEIEVETPAETPAEAPAVAPLNPSATAIE